MRKRKIIGSASVAASVSIHLGLLAMLLFTRTGTLKLDNVGLEQAAFTVALTPKLPPAPDVEAAQQSAASTPATKAGPVKPPPKRTLGRRLPPTENSTLLSATEKSAPEPSQGVSESELAGAATADAGSGSENGSGSDCNMVRRLQAALRKDSLVRAAVAAAHDTRAIRIWNGDWVQGAGEDGKGMAAVREAILWEIGFAPKACQAQPVHGLVALSLGIGGAPLVMGGGAWRWSDLLSLKGAAPTYK